VEVLAFHQSNKSPSRILKMETPKTKYHANAGRNHGEDIELRQPLIFKGINETANGIREQSGTRASFCLEMRESLADEESAEASPKAEHIKTPLMLETPNSQKGAWRASYSLEKFLGIQPDGEIVAILLIYFVQGALGLARLATTFFLKDELHPLLLSRQLSLAFWLFRGCLNLFMDLFLMAFQFWDRSGVHTSFFQGFWELHRTLH